ncbi:hypothetical protein ACHAWF_009870 [Thalassiosira exigua]
MTHRRDEMSRSSVPTMDGPKPQTIVSLTHIESARDLDDLARTDPFSYHSIPEVRRAKARGEEADHEALARRITSSDGPSSSGAKEATKSTNTTTTTVKRSSCISYESHPDLLMEEFFGSDDDGGDCDRDSGEDPVDPMELLLSQRTTVARDERDVPRRQ